MTKKYVEMLENYGNSRKWEKNRMENSWKEIFVFGMMKQISVYIINFYLHLAHKDRYAFGVFCTLAMINNEAARNAVRCAK